MIELRWTEAAIADIEQITDYLFESSPAHAGRIIHAIYDGAGELRHFPGIGRPGRVSGTRELVLTGLPYLVVYVHRNDAIHVARVLHGAQRWP